MKQDFFNKDQSSRCAYCEKGTLSPTGNEVLCPAKGVVKPDYCCRKYVYDPLKRQPERRSAAAGFSAEDFKL